MPDFIVFPKPIPTKCSFRLIDPRTGEVWDEDAGAMSATTTFEHSIVLCGTDGGANSISNGFHVSIPAAAPKGRILNMLLFGTDAPVAATEHIEGYEIYKNSAGKVVFTDSKLF